MATRRDREQAEQRKSQAVAWADEQKSEYEPTSYKLPDGVAKYKPKAPSANVDIIPYPVGTKNPLADEGTTHFVMTYFVHNGLGQDGKSTYVCPTTWKKPCAICHFLATQGNQADKALVDAIYRQRRNLFCVVDHTASKKPDGSWNVQVWDVSHGGQSQPSFGHMLQNKLTAAPEEYEDFTELTREKGGKTLLLTVVDSSFQKGNKNIAFTKVTNIEMVKKKVDYDKSVTKVAPCLDELLIELSPKQMAKLLTEATAGPGSDEEDDDDKSPPKNGRATARKPAKDPDPDDDDDDPEEDDSDLEPAPAARGKKPADDDDDSDLEPAAKKPVGKKPPKDDDDDDPPPTTRTSASGKKYATAESKGIKVGMTVSYDDQDYKVTKISKDGTTLTLEDDEDTQTGINVAEVEVPAPKGKPPKQPPVKRPDPDDDDPEESASEDDSDLEPPAKTPGRTSRR